MIKRTNNETIITSLTDEIEALKKKIDSL